MEEISSSLLGCFRKLRRGLNPVAVSSPGMYGRTCLPSCNVSPARIQNPGVEWSAVNVLAESSAESW